MARSRVNALSLSSDASKGIRYANVEILSIEVSGTVFV
jgi:hypothetical protein